MKILVTSGATREPIDSVRFLSNISTGATGAAIADALAEAGHTVLLLSGEGSVRARNPGVDRVSFGSTEDLARRAAGLLGAGDFQVVIQAAAISDYRPERVLAQKMSSDAPRLDLCLVPTPKLMPLLKGWSPRPLRVVGFKLTHDGDPVVRDRAVARLFAGGKVDAVVQNDVLALETEGARRRFRFYRGELADFEELPGLPSLLLALRGWVDKTPPASPWTPVTVTARRTRPAPGEAQTAGAHFSPGR